MKLYFMKQSALDYIKTNFDKLYVNYYTYNSPQWIYDLFDYDPFEVFDIVDDFELASLSLKPGEIDFENCKILYTQLKKLSDSQASDERLWAGLCNKTFYEYNRERMKLSVRHLKKASDDSGAILSRFFYKSTSRSGMFRNALARCWWTGRLTYTDKYANHWELLDSIGPEDMISKINDLFYSNTFSSNKDIVEGICEGLKFFRNRDINITVRDHIRPMVQYLNAVGGCALLDIYSAEEIKAIVVECIGILINNKDSGIIFNLDNETDDTNNFDNNEDADAEEVNVDYEDYLDALEPTIEINIDEVLGSLEKVEYGCSLIMKNVTANSTYMLKIPLANEPLKGLQKWAIGKSVGDSKIFAGSTYEIVSIQRN